MPRQSAVRTFQEFDEPVPARDIDYAAAYRTLELPPGAALREVQDRARLVGAAFQPEGLPGGLMVLARDRAEAAGRAAEALSHYWQTYGKAPPSGEPARLRMLPGAPSAPTMSTRSAAAGRVVPLPASSARAGAVPAVSRSRSVRSLVLKAALIGLVVVAAFRVQQYRADHPSPGAPGEANAAIATAMPNAGPAQWSGMAASRQMVGAAAPAISGHRRQN